MVKLNRVSTPEMFPRNIAEVESRSTSAISRATISVVDTRVQNIAGNIARNFAPCVRAENGVEMRKLGEFFRVGL